jgi:hypothetical protein
MSQQISVVSISAKRHGFMKINKKYKKQWNFLRHFSSRACLSQAKTGMTVPLS